MPSTPTHKQSIRALFNLKLNLATIFILQRAFVNSPQCTVFVQNGLRIASAGFSCSGLGTFGWTSVGRWRTRMSRLGSSRGPRLLNRTRCYPKNGHPTRRFLQLLSARKADSDTVPEVALRCSPSATKGNGRHHGLRAGLQSPEANCRQFMCFSPLLHRLPRQAPISAAFDGRRASGPGTTAGSQTAGMVLRDLHRSAGDKAGETASWTGLG